MFADSVCAVFGSLPVQVLELVSFDASASNEAVGDAKQIIIGCLLIRGLFKMGLLWGYYQTFRSVVVSLLLTFF